jgi:hypothetical protein
MPCRHSRSATGRGPGDFSGHGGSSGSISIHKSSSTIHGRALTPSRTAESSHRSRPTRALQQDRVTSSRRPPMTDRELARRARHRLTVLRHADEPSGNIAATCRYYVISASASTPGTEATKPRAWTASRTAPALRTTLRMPRRQPDGRGRLGSGGLLAGLGRPTPLAGPPGPRGGPVSGDRTGRVRASSAERPTRTPGASVGAGSVKALQPLAGHAAGSWRRNALPPTSVG